MNHPMTYVGWLGYKNTGDEALYAAISKIFSDYSFNHSLYKQNSQITFFGGGTLIPGHMVWTKPNKYNYAYGVGVMNTAFWGDPEPLLIERLRDFNFRFLGVRDFESQKKLRDWGIKSDVIGDPGLLLEANSYVKKDNHLIGLTLGPSRGAIWGENQPRILEETVELCKVLIHNNYRPVLIPFSADDITYYEKISKSAKIPIFQNWGNIQQVLDFISSCHLVIGEKLHSLVFSAATFTPFISIEYRPKCVEFAKVVGFEKFNIRTDEYTSERVLQLFDCLSNNWDIMRERLVRNVEVYRKKLREYAAQIVDDVESLPISKWDVPNNLARLSIKPTYRLSALLYNNVRPIWRVYANLIYSKGPMPTSSERG